MSFKKLLLLSLYCTVLLQACEGDFHPPAERYSPWVNWVMNKLAASDSLQEFSRQKRALCTQELSNSVHADLFKNAQEEIGIAQEDILPVIDVSVQDCPEIPKTAVACTMGNKIQVISKNFNHQPYGAQRIVAIHESFHNKYHDAYFEQWFIQKITMAGIINACVSTLGLLRLNYKHISHKGLRVAGYIGLPVVSTGGSLMLSGLLMHKSGLLDQPSTSYDFFKEYRADRDAVKHANCYRCVQEFKEVCGDNLPYLRQSELDAYIKSFEKGHKICSVHRLDNQQS